VWSIFIPENCGTADSLSAALWQMGTAGIVEEEGGWRAFFDDTVDSAAICARFDLAQTAVRPEPPFDASSLAPSECDPILIGERFYLAPSWVREAAPQGRWRLTIDSSSAFGSGRHESTQLCMEALERHLQPGGVVVDIGCGSGILSAAAHLLGAGTVFSCDIHADSVKTARTLVETPLFVGSADAIRAGVADLVLANISAKIVDGLAADLRRVAKPSGLIVLAGFLNENPPARFHAWRVLKRGDWECWISRTEDIEVIEADREPVTHSEQWWS
jgi:ribosomal protein L11 methyltransferase